MKGYAQAAFGGLVAMSLATAAFAQPAVFTDLGTLNCTEFSAPTVTAAPGEVVWFKVTLPAIIDDPAYYCDIWVNSSSGMPDSVMFMFDSAGMFVTADDDSGNDYRSMITLGSTTNIRPDPDAPMEYPLDGFNGEITGGVYWIAVVGYAALGDDGWIVETDDELGGTIDLRINVSDPVCSGLPTNPMGAGVGGSVGPCGGTVLAAVTVTGGLNPASTGIAVTLDTAAIGGGVVSLLDNGTNGDVTAGDNVFSRSIAIAGGAEATFTMPFTITDAESRTNGGNITAVRANDVGDLPASAKKYYGSVPPATALVGNIGGDADSDMFAICVSDTANFEASVNNGGAAFDTQLFLFNADGTGAAMNDDEPDAGQTLQSHMMLNNSLLPAAAPVVLSSGGLHYLAIAGYDRDPITSGLVADTIWADTATTPAFSYDATWAPNGTTPAAPIAGWSGTSNNDGGDYTITLVGAATVCPADLANSGGAGPDCAVDINDLLFFLTAFEAGVADVADSSGNGNQDCATDINDLLFFLQRFEAGC